MKYDAAPAVSSGAPKKQVSVSTLVVGCVLSAIIFFVLGTRADLLPVFGSQTTNPANTNAPAELDFSSLNEVYKTLRARYDGQLDTNKLIDGARHGLVDAAGDPYTVYLNPEEAKQFSSDLNGTFEGIGAELGKNDGQLTILSVIADSPAQKSGLLSRDIILKVNDEATSAMTVGTAVSKIRGAKGTTVKLTILRNGDSKDYTITRDSITSPSVNSEILGGDVGYLKISRFGDDTAGLARRAAEDFASKGIKRVVVDLRGNGGGLLTASQQVASLWLNNKVIVTERSGSAVKDTLRSIGSPVLEGVRTVVLVDGSSASASEIVAGALKDNGAATLLGEKTFGKGSVQIVEDLSNGAQLKVTIAKWYTPNGLNINKEGIKPDKEIKLSEEDVKAGKDPQKEAALAEVRR